MFYFFFGTFMIFSYQWSDGSESNQTAKRLRYSPNSFWWGAKLYSLNFTQNTPTENIRHTFPFLMLSSQKNSYFWGVNLLWAFSQTPQYPFTKRWKTWVVPLTTSGILQQKELLSYSHRSTCRSGVLQVWFRRTRGTTIWCAGNFVDLTRWMFIHSLI